MHLEMQREAAAEVERVRACVCECMCACKCVCVRACTCMCVCECVSAIVVISLVIDTVSQPNIIHATERCCLVITFPLSLLICPKPKPTSSRHQEKRSSSGGAEGSQQYI